MTTPCSWHFTGIHLLYFSMLPSISLFQSSSSNTCPYTFSCCEHKLISVSHYSLFISRCSFYASIFYRLFPLTIHLKTKLFFILLQQRPSLLPYFVLLLFMILNFFPSNCAIKAFQKQSQDTQFEDQPDVLGPCKSILITLIRKDIDAKIPISSAKSLGVSYCEAGSPLPCSDFVACCTLKVFFAPGGRKSGSTFLCRKLRF